MGKRNVTHMQLSLWDDPVPEPSKVETPDDHHMVRPPLRLSVSQVIRRSPPHTQGLSPYSSGGLIMVSPIGRNLRPITFLQRT